MSKMLKVTHKDLIDRAMAEIETLSLDDAHALLGRDDVVFVDIRDPRELQREGKIPGAYHAPRGMLEFWIDPTSPYFKDVFGSGKKFVFYCQSAWRSALSTQTLQQMGLAPVCHIAGGYRAWKDAGLPTEEVPAR
ncbi:MAG: rhodanese-like domain-containing protein [Pseudomonadales bacterium]|nr:rhodanese-like domain-containing protein [Pseudomonadales bacterium]MCP5184845.1 rhodanese-like domain-containing protein [Pseudomonadales bacterium]